MRFLIIMDSEHFGEDAHGRYGHASESNAYNKNHDLSFF